MEYLGQFPLTSHVKKCLGPKQEAKCVMHFLLWHVPFLRPIPARSTAVFRLGWRLHCEILSARFPSHCSSGCGVHGTIPLGSAWKHPEKTTLSCVEVGS